MALHLWPVFKNVRLLTPQSISEVNVGPAKSTKQILWHMMVYGRYICRYGWTPNTPTNKDIYISWARIAAVCLWLGRSTVSNWVRHIWCSDENSNHKWTNPTFPISNAMYTHIYVICIYIYVNKKNMKLFPWRSGMRQWFPNLSTRVDWSTPDSGAASDVNVR